MFSARRGLALCTAAVFAATIIPMTAFAGADPAHGELKPPGLRAQANVAPDSYEFDDTTATAKPMPTASYHTWHPLADGANDVDFMYFTVEETGTPIYLETWTPGKATSFSDPYIKVYDEEGALNVAQQPFDFDGALVSSDDHLDTSLDAGLVFVAPHPGKYYVRLQSDDWGSGQWGEYWLFARRGIVPVIDDTVVERQRVLDYLADVETRPLRLVLLSPPLEIALTRDRVRGYKQVGDIWIHLDALMRDEMVGIGLWLDNSALTAEETVVAILDQLPQTILDSLP